MYMYNMFIYLFIYLFIYSFNILIVFTNVYDNVYIENNTWARGNTRFISSVEHDIMLNTGNKSGISCRD